MHFAALRPAVELLPVPSLTVKRQFSVGGTAFTLRANLEVELIVSMRPIFLKALCCVDVFYVIHVRCIILSILSP